MSRFAAWFSRRARNLTVAAACIGAVIAVLSPGLTVAERIAVPCAVILFTALAYGFVLILLGAVAKFSITVLKIYGYTFFIAGLLAIVGFPVLIVDGIADLGMSAFERAAWFGGFVPMGIAVSWAASVALGREHLLPNTEPERTRGE